MPRASPPPAPAPVQSDRFGGFQMSLITLFAVLNGDVMRETFLVLLPYSPAVTQIYLYSFICLFIYVVLNVFIATIELAFFSTCVETLAHEGKEGGSSQGFYAAALPHTQPIADGAAASDAAMSPAPANTFLQRRVEAATGNRPRASSAVPPSSAAFTPRRGTQPFHAKSPQPTRAGGPQKDVDRLDLLLQQVGVTPPRPPRPCCRTPTRPRPQTERLSLDSVAGSLSTGRMADVKSLDGRMDSDSDSDSNSNSGSAEGRSAGTTAPETEGSPAPVPSPTDGDGGEPSFGAEPTAAGALTSRELPASVRVAMDQEYEELLSSLASDLALGRAAPEGGTTDAEQLQRLQEAQRRGFATLRSIVRDAALRSPAAT